MLHSVARVPPKGRPPHGPSHSSWQRNIALPTYLIRQSAVIAVTAAVAGVVTGAGAARVIDGSP